jgi:hypothetical protein
VRLGRHTSMIMKHNGSVLSIELYKDKHNHTHKKRDLEVISRSTRFKEFNREKKQQQKHRISLKSFRESGHVMLVLALQNFATVVSLLSLNKLHFRYFRSSSWVELRLTQIFSMAQSNSRWRESTVVEKLSFYIYILNNIDSICLRFTCFQKRWKQIMYL